MSLIQRSGQPQCRSTRQPSQPLSFPKNLSIRFFSTGWLFNFRLKAVLVAETKTKKESDMTAMTWSQLEKITSEGRGQGWGKQYLPWLWIRRRNPSPVSNQVAGAMLPGLHRECCFLARIEWLIALLCYWIGAIDVREQFPLWPWPHPHPIRELPSGAKLDLPDSPGLIEVARHAGIEHGRFIGSDVPYVATTDLAVTVPSDNGMRLVGIAVKAEKKLLESEPADTTRARLELERRYHVGMGNHVAVATEELVPRMLGAQLGWFSSAARLPDSLDEPTRIVDFASMLVEAAVAETLERGIAVAAASMGYTHDDANLLFRHCVWRRLIDIDLSSDVEMSYPPRLNGNRLVSILQAKLFGETK
jgi:hypothetical protein